MGNLVSIRGLEKRFGDFALRSVDLSVDAVVQAGYEAPIASGGQVVLTFFISQGLVPINCLLSNAPVGQTLIHCPQNLQFSVLIKI